MNENDFAKIESSLGIELPQAYRQIMASYPFADSTPSQLHLPDNAEYICGLNQYIHGDQVYRDHWRAGYLAIGTKSCGDAYFIDTIESQTAVYTISQDEFKINLIATSIDNWTKKLVEWYIEFEEERVQKDYDPITSKLIDAGYFATDPEPMDGWNRIIVSTQPGGGCSFWIGKAFGNWFAGTWGGMLYLAAEFDSLINFTIESFVTNPSGTAWDFEPEVVEKHGLVRYDNNAFDDLESGQT